MKKILLVVLLAVTAFACGTDDDASSDVSVSGTWNLTYFGGETPVDFNGDGTASANIITETGCYAGSNIVFMSEGTAIVNNTTYADIAVVVESGNETNASYDVTCESDPEAIPATWTKNGTTIAIQQNGGTTISGTQDGDQITFTIQSGSVVEVINDDGTTATVIEDLSLVYEKQ